MSGGLKVGDLYVLLSAKTSAFGKSMESAAKLTERVANRIKRAATEIGRLGAMIGAGIGAALAVAAQHNAAVAAEVQKSKDVFASFANEVAQMMLPALREMNQHLRELLGWWQSLSPETKAQIAHWVAIATGVGLAALAFGKLAGLVSAVASILGTLGGVVAGVSFAPLLVALAAVAIGIAVVHKAWRENWGGIQQKTHTAIEAISGYWQSFKDWLSTGFFGWFIDQWAEIERALRHAQSFLKHPLDSSARKSLNDAGDRELEDWKKSMKGGAMGASLKLAFKPLEDGAGAVVSEWKEIASEVGDAFKKAIGWTGAAGNPASTAAPLLKTAATNGGMLADAHVQEYYANQYGSTNTEDLIRSGSRLGDADEQGLTTARTAETYREEITMRERFNDELARVGGSLKAAGVTVVSKLGAVGEVIASGIQGFQSGGIWGALIAVFVELLSRFERFQELIDIGNGQMAQTLEALKPGLNAIMDALRETMGAIGLSIEPVMKILNPILKIVGKAFQMLAAPLGLIATLLEPIAWLFEIIGGLFDGLMDVLKPFIEIFSIILKIVGLTILGTMNGLLYVWIGILTAVREFMKLIGANTSEVDKLFIDAITKQAEIQNKMRKLWDQGYDGLASNSANASEAIGRLGDTADRVSAQLTNVPQGFSVALARLAAAGATSSSSGGAVSYGSYERERERQAFRNTGNATSHSYHRGKNKNDSSEN